jgi:hypothetical protein
LLATAIAGLIQARSNYQTQTAAEKIKFQSESNLERTKFESDLILKAVETGDQAASTRNLVFLLKAGFIRDEHGTITALAKDADAVPVLPSRAYTSGAFEGIPPEGVGGDPDLNVLKNRDLPPPQYVPMTLEEIVTLPTPSAPEINTGRRSSWSQKALEGITRIEARGVTVEAYLKRVHAARPTAANARRQGVQSHATILPGPR